MKCSNLLRPLPDAGGGEIFEDLVRGTSWRLERIVSAGQATPAGQWCDQDRDEWVVLLKGAATLEFEGQSEPCTLQPGDYVHIPARRRHRVRWTSTAEPTVWLALHFTPVGNAALAG